MKTTTKFLGALLPGAMLILCVNCSGADLWDSVPSEVKTFISLYYPDSELASYNKDAGGNTVVELKDGPGFTFNSSGSWTSISGNGLPIKEILIYDQTPTPLYEYLEGIEAASGVFDMSRDSKEYHLTLLDSQLTYTISTGKVEGCDRE